MRSIDPFRLAVTVSDNLRRDRTKFTWKLDRVVEVIEDVFREHIKSFIMF
jgi:hypothetical protein